MHSTSALPRSNGSTSILGLFGLCLVLIAAFGPTVQQPALYHAFADQRALLGIPHALDVLSNLPFLLLGLFGMSRLRQIVDARWQGLYLLLCLGLLLTFLGSSAYHLAPADAGLLYDRLGMLVLFAAILGLAAADRLGFTAARMTALGVALGGSAALWAWYTSGNLLPWIVLQAGGMLLLVMLACCRPRRDAHALRLGLCVVWYALAKLCELNDSGLFHLSGEWLSGHSLKHLLSGLAVLPLLLPLFANRTKH
ncbi:MULTISPECIES: hypothetical protein [unclassified Pseudomonas]|uniref:hypothetical protein n=1 Tax=unclassified Pseudomonas TaxID=196821 RepID=UPI002448329C|nr:MULTISPECIES: hypothetical protein [unclassified Pseudomonas]MDG9924365.1 hypothetical protein [Pseudomonas sp. GD04045]MDH0033406.1 hypothetical protein [Pseudomonas sp. GD04019]